MDNLPSITPSVRIITSAQPRCSKMAAMTVPFGVSVTLLTSQRGGRLPSRHDRSTIMSDASEHHRLLWAANVGSETATLGDEMFVTGLVGSKSKL